MPLYTFYPTQSDGLAQSFEILDLRDDDEALGETLRVFDRHRSAASVVVYRDQRKIYARLKIDEAPRSRSNGATTL